MECYARENLVYLNFPDLQFALNCSIATFNPTEAATKYPLQQVEDAEIPESISHVKKMLCFRSPKEEFQILFFDNVPGIAYRRLIFPEKSPFHLTSINEQLEFPEESPWHNLENVNTFHGENPRLYQRLIIPALADRTLTQKASFDSFEAISGTIWAGDGNLRKEIGRSPFQPFPAIIYLLKDSDQILLDGTLTQQRFNRCYGIEKGKVVFKQCAKTVKHLIVKDRETIYGEWNYLEVANSKDLNHPYDHFLTAVENFGAKFRGARKEAHQEMIWGSWNDGIFRNIDEDNLLQTADVLKRDFPAVRWVQIDDGYDDWDYPSNPHGRIGIGVAYEGERVSPVKFPNGIRHFTDEVRKKGLRPALWVGLSVSTLRKWYVERPEDFVLYQQNPHFAFPDISKENVRDFIEEAFRMFIQDWGFEGIKLDFWSYFFEDEQVMIPAAGITGYEYRRWFLDMLRRLLPEDGYLQTGCDIAMSNIHLGEEVDNYRYGIDIGSGNWNNVKTNVLWAAFCLNTKSGRFCVPNSDGIGIFPGLGRTEAETAINFCLVTRTCMELSGWLHRTGKNPLTPFLRKTCCAPDNGADIYFGDFNFKETQGAPVIWYFKGAHFSYDCGNTAIPLVTAGCFNWGEDPLELSLHAQTLSLDNDKTYLLKDFWTDELLEIPANGNLTLMLQPHGSRLFCITEKTDRITVLDANIQLNNVHVNKNDLLMDIPHSPDPKSEIIVSAVPENIISNGKKAAFTANPCGTAYRIIFETE